MVEHTAKAVRSCTARLARRGLGGTRQLGLLAVVAAVAVLVTAAVPRPVAAQPRPARPCPGVGFQPPTSAVVIDPFRPPASPFGPGNRGLTYATVAGSPVSAIGAGVVRFAGPIAGQWYVTVGHSADMDSTYSFLASVVVSAGDVVRGGDVVGLAGALPFHLGVRRNGAYVDPATVLGSAPSHLRARLVPNDRFGDGGGCARPAAVRAGPSAAPGGATALATVGQAVAGPLEHAPPHSGVGQRHAHLARIVRVLSTTLPSAGFGRFSREAQAGGETNRRSVRTWLSSP